MIDPKQKINLNYENEVAFFFFFFFAVLCLRFDLNRISTYLLIRKALVIFMAYSLIKSSFLV